MNSRALSRCVLRVNTNLFLSGKNNYDKQGFDSFLHGREKNIDLSSSRFGEGRTLEVSASPLNGGQFTLIT